MSTFVPLWSAHVIPHPMYGQTVLDSSSSHFPIFHPLMFFRRLDLIILHPPVSGIVWYVMREEHGVTRLLTPDAVVVVVAHPAVRRTLEDLHT